MADLPARLRKEAARGNAEAGKECCYAPWTCCDHELLETAARRIEQLEQALIAVRASTVIYSKPYVIADDALATWQQSVPKMPHTCGEA